MYIHSIMYFQKIMVNPVKSNVHSCHKLMRQFRCSW